MSKKQTAMERTGQVIQVLMIILAPIALFYADLNALNPIPGTLFVPSLQVSRVVEDIALLYTVFLGIITLALLSEFMGVTSETPLINVPVLFLASSGSVLFLVFLSFIPIDLSYSAQWSVLGISVVLLMVKASVGKGREQI